MGFFPAAMDCALPVRRYLCSPTGIDQLITTGVVREMAQDITKILKSLQTTAVNRCRERLDEAALRAKNLIGRGGEAETRDPAPETPQYGVTSVLKRKHGL